MIRALLCPFLLRKTAVITIDNRIEQGLFDQTGGIGDFDGFQESLKAKAGYDEWYSFFDTTQLPDGPLDIYAVAYDDAGNMSYTLADGQIANNPPAISSVVVGSTTIDDTSDKTKISGSVNFTINLSDAEGIDVSTVQLYITERYTIVSGAPDTVDGGYTPPAALTSVDFDSITPGTDSTVEVVVENVDTTAFTSGYYYHYVAQANDTDGNLVQRLFYVWVNNNDVSAPVVTIDDFSQTSVSGGIGHVEEEISSLNDAADPDTLNDADLSGTVTVSGTAYDDSTVTTLTVEYSLNNGSTWSDAGTAMLGTGVGDVINGYDYNWTYDWDTSSIATVAEEDVLIRAYGTDGTNTTAEGSRPEKTVDIVPYITGISGTGLESGLLAYVKRSATGRYPIVIGSTLTISGYNLPGTTANAFSIGGTVLTASGAAGSSEMTVPLLTTSTSGDIFVVTNTINSLNNANDNTLIQNKEVNLYNATLNDNREAVFWDLSSIAGTDTVTDPTMHPNAGGTGYDWMYVRSGQDLYLNPDGSAEKLLTEGTGLKGGTLTYNDSGSLVFLFNHSAEWSFYDGSFAFTGSVQYGQIANLAAYSFTTAEDEAYNWNQNSNFAKLGIGNVNHYFTGENNVSENPIPYASYSDVDLNRYENLILRTVGTDALTRNYVAYFDTGAGESRSIVFYGFQTADSTGAVSATSNVYSNVTAPTTESDAGGGIFANIDKFSNAGPTENVALAGTQKSNNLGIATPRGRQEVTTANSGNDSSQFDLGIYEVNATTHYGFIAFFDESSQSLKITANESLYNADPTGVLGTWTTAQEIDTTAGVDVAMAVDPDGGIHLAYQDVSTGYLKYAYVTYDDVANTFTAAPEKIVYVDALFGAGANNSIAVKDFGGTDYRPVILTYSSAFTGTAAPIRLSYPLVEPTDAAFDDGADSSTGAFLGNWETIALPAGSAPDNEKNYLFIDASGNAHIGYEASTLEEATFLGF